MKHILEFLDDEFKGNLSYLQRTAKEDEETIIYFGKDVDFSLPDDYEWWMKNQDFKLDFVTYDWDNFCADCCVRFRGSLLSRCKDLGEAVEIRNVKI